MNRKFSRIWVYLQILLGVVGTVLFFPVNLGGEYTCLYHRVFTKESSKHPRNSMYSSISESNNQDSRDRSKDHSIHQKHLLNKYVIPYGLSWWGSLGLVGTGLFVIQRLNKITNSSNRKD